MTDEGRRGTLDAVGSTSREATYLNPRSQRTGCDWDSAGMPPDSRFRSGGPLANARGFCEYQSLTLVQ
jgi:hypothetical protein